MKKSTLTKNEEIAKHIANLKGKELEEYMRDVNDILAFVNKRLKEKNHSPRMIQAYQETKKSLEDLLVVIEPNRSN